MSSHHGSTSRAGGPSEPLDAGALVAACEEAVRTYEPAKTTVDSHAGDFLAAKRITDPDDARFVQQVMYGCMRYKKLLKIFLSSLYFKHGGETQRADRTLYQVLGYLALLRLHELGFAEFKALVMSQEHFKMSVFLKFLFSEENLQQWLRPEWLKLYEPSFVDEQLIGKCLVFVPHVEKLREALEGQMASEAAAKEAAAEAARALAEGRGGQGKHTTPEPFNITKPAVRLAPAPEHEIEATYKANEVPKTTAPGFKPKEWAAIDAAKDKNRLIVKAQYSDPTKQPFKLKAVERPNNLEKVRKEVEAAREAECDFDGPKANPIPRQKAGQGQARRRDARRPLTPPPRPAAAASPSAARRHPGAPQLGGDPPRGQPVPQEAARRGGAAWLVRVGAEGRVGVRSVAA